MALETEVKFYIQRPADLEHRIQALAAHTSEPRVFETNLRFDTPGGKLRRAGRVLRLRQDKSARLTYKEDSRFEAGALSRREVEFTVSDFNAAREFIEALGYRVALIYEKYRTTYTLDRLEIMLDEMPYGPFVEIEGDADALKSTAQELGLHWEMAIPESYSALFDRLRARRRLGFRDLTFNNFEGIEIAASDLGVQPADS